MQTFERSSDSDGDETRWDSIERQRLRRAGSLHWFHWVIVALSLVLTVGAWRFAQHQVDERRRRQFDREADRVVDLIQERMGHYEDALWAGAALYHTLDGEVRVDDWVEYTDQIRIEEKYPGINGIGLIHHVSPGDLEDFLEAQRLDRPGFRVHPEHDRSELMPITLIEPVEGNAPAVGLDMAHETNRYLAACRARETGVAQITGPIVLVQDEERTPGFLFYVPLYSSPGVPPEERRVESFRGLVYAPFVVSKLMRGTLSRESRSVGVTMADDDQVLYDENTPEDPEYDADPQFTRQEVVTLYGRNWAFDVHSARSFRSAQESWLPLTILIGGLVIDGMLVGLFVMISRANRQALSCADEATIRLEEKARDLEQSNRELERFAYIASHDLQEPLRMVGSFAELLDEEYADRFDEQGASWLQFMVDGARRMQALVRGLLDYSRVGREEAKHEPVDMNALLEDVLVELSEAIEEAGAEVSRDDCPSVLGHRAQLHGLLLNLVSNAVKFRAPDRRPRVHVECRTVEGRALISVEDNGIGIDEQYAERVFEIFQRLHVREEYPGTGIGLAVAKKVVELHGGDLEFRSEPGQWTRFFFTLPLAPASSGSAAPALPARERRERLPA